MFSALLFALYSLFSLFSPALPTPNGIGILVIMLNLNIVLVSPTRDHCLSPHEMKYRTSKLVHPTYILLNLKFFLSSFAFGHLHMRIWPLPIHFVKPPLGVAELRGAS